MIVILNGANSSKTVATLISSDTAIYSKATHKEEESFFLREVTVRLNVIPYDFIIKYDYNCNRNRLQRKPTPNI